MQEMIKQKIAEAKAYWNSLEKKTRKKTILFSILLLISLATSAVVLNKTEYAVLYSDLDLKEAGEISAILDELNIKSKSGEDGTILVEKDQEEEIRMQLAVQGYPKSGLNYDLYLNSINFTTSTHDKNIMLLYQLQDRLSNTIKLLQGVTDAIVTISMEVDDVFKFGNEVTPVSANVLLELEDNFDPSIEQIRAIQRLMVTSVAGLKDENVVIIDSNLNDLLPANLNDPLSKVANTQFELQQEVENKLAEKVLFLFEPVFGAKNIKVAVNAAINLDKRTTESIEYSPVIDQEGIPYIIDELSERFSDTTTNNNAGSDSLNDRMQSVINYRVNELRESVEEAQGNIEDVSISILINNAEMDQDSLDDVRRIAAAAVGVEENSINVSNMNFSASEEYEQAMAEALAQAELNNKKTFPISEKTLIGLISIFLSFIFALVVFNTYRKNSVIKMKAQSEIAATGVDASEEAMLQENIASAHDEIKRNEALQASMEERSMLDELEQIIKTSPKNVADLVAYWLETGDTDNNLMEERKNE